MASSSKSSSSALKTANDVLAGSAAGIAQVLASQPLDTIKTRAQIAPKGMFKGPLDIAMQTIRKEGFFALYKGMASPLVGMTGVNALLFASYGAAKRIVSPFPELSIGQTAIAGGMAGAANTVLASPVELFKIRMQGQYGTSGDKKLRHVASELWSQWGFRQGIMRGFWVTFAREIPAYASFYAAFEFTKRKFGKQYDGQIPTWALLASGSTGGVAYWLSCYPLDVIKSRIQLRPIPPTGNPLRYMNDELRAIVAEGGAASLYRGLVPTLLRTLPAAASTFAAYELSREWLLESTGA